MAVLRVAVAALSIAASLAAPHAGAARAGSTRQASLSFVRGSSIYRVSPDGLVSLVLRGTGGFTGKSYFDPAWSKDGRLLAVTVKTYPSHDVDDVYVLTSQKRLLPVPGGDSSFSGKPSWAPDGLRVVLVGYQSREGGGLYIARVGSPTNIGLTREWLYEAPGAAADDMPAWSPDGSTIAFARTRNGHTRLYTIRPNASGLKQVTTTSAWNPSWSPESKQVAFDTGRRIAVIDADGRNLRYLTDPNGRDADPAWSPDGRTIAFVRYRSAESTTGDIWLVNATGGGLKLFVRNATQPAWKRG